MKKYQNLGCVLACVGQEPSDPPLNPPLAFVFSGYLQTTLYCLSCVVLKPFFLFKLSFPHNEIKGLRCDSSAQLFC